MSRVLCTGGCGLLGRHLVDYLVCREHQVIVVDDLSNSTFPKEWERHPQIAFRELDITLDYAADAMVTHGPFSVVYHLAAHAYEGLSQFTPCMVSETAVIGTLNVLRAAIMAGTVNRFVNCSSMARYGSGQCVSMWNKEGGVSHPDLRPSDPPFVEYKHIEAPEDIYGHGKVMAERCVETLCELHEIEWCHAVPHNVVGEANLKALSDPYRGVLLIWANQLLRGVPITIFGDGEQMRAPSYVGDVVPYLAGIGFNDDCVFETINLGAERAYTINQMAESIRKAFLDLRLMGRKDPGIRHEPARPCEVKNAYCSVEKSVRLLGYADRTSLDEMSGKIMRWAYAVAPNGLDPRYLDKFEIESKAPKVWLEHKM